MADRTPSGSIYQSWPITNGRLEVGVALDRPLTQDEIACLAPLIVAAEEYARTFPATRPGFDRG